MGTVPERSLFIFILLFVQPQTNHLTYVVLKSRQSHISSIPAAGSFLCHTANRTLSGLTGTQVSLLGIWAHYFCPASQYNCWEGNAPCFVTPSGQGVTAPSANEEQSWVGWKRSHDQLCLYCTGVTRRHSSSSPNFIAQPSGTVKRLDKMFDTEDIDW